MKQQPIILKKVSVHNLKEVNLTLNPNELIVFSGVSGSGKSSLAFDTIYMEGQRRYVESLSTFARRYLGDIAKPEVESVSGLSPTISIEQKTAGKNPRSTVGTMTEIYDYMRVLYARVALPHCPVSGEPVSPQSKERIIRTIQNLPEKTKVLFLAPYAKDKKGEFKDDFIALIRKGFMRVRVDGSLIDLSEEISLDKNLSHTVDIVIDRLVVTPENNSRIAEAVITALEQGLGVLSVANLNTGEETLFSMHAFSPKSGLSYSSLEPHDFSFNSPGGMCPKCHGLGKTMEFDLSLIIDPNLSISEDCCTIAPSYNTVRYGNIYDNLAELYGFKVTTPWKKLSEKAKQIYLNGVEQKWVKMQFIHPVKASSWTDYIHWKGVLWEAHQRYAEAKSDRYRTNMERLMKEQLCPSCNGSKLKPYPSAALFNGKKIHELTALTTKECLDFFNAITLTPSEQIIAEELLKEIRQRLKFLLDVGLHYLTLDRTSPTLSGGEAQRVRLASQVGSGLVGVTYVLDEPSIGLHPRDNTKLIGTLKRLKEIGNTVIVVEHDEETLWAADRIVDFGPGPGSKGGKILVNGSLKDLLNCKESLTGDYLSGRKKIEIPKKRRKIGERKLVIRGASHNNLKNIDVEIPLGVLVAVTGVSGSGKSSLITDILHPALANYHHHGEMPVGEHSTLEGKDLIDKVIAIDQSPIGRNPRSNPATYIKIFDDIRTLFSQLPESMAKGYGPGRFSFNVSDGSCSECHGMGMVKVDMDFLEDAWVPCHTCKAKRFDKETLEIHYKCKSIYDVLEMTVGEAREFFTNIPHLKHKLDVVARVGMEYIKLGQPSTTLSGGEAQRIKLAKELVRPSSGNTFYILDEPTTGLHFHDINFLLSVLQELVDRGNSVLIIEHNMDVVKTCDWVIDLGPEGGAYGGEIIGVGTPEKIAKTKNPTGVALKQTLTHNPEELSQAVIQKKKKEEPSFEIKEISVKGAEQNNLKHLDITIPRQKMTICTGPSGSGKSSFAFETVYAEGQRRYIESLSPYARQFVKQMPKPKVSQIEGLSPAIAIEQKASSGNPRSTIGTMTEVYDYLRILYARIGIAYCPETGEVIKSITKEYVLEQIFQRFLDQKLIILAPLELEKNDKFEDLIQRFKKQGYLRIRVNSEIYELDDKIPFDRKRKNTIALVIDRLKVQEPSRNRIYSAIENAANLSQGKMIISAENEEIFYNLSFSVESTGKSYPPITPHTFSFNSSEGMCMDCQGLGYQYGANLTQNPEIMQLTVMGLLRRLWDVDFEDSELFEFAEEFFTKNGIDFFSALQDLNPEQLFFLFNGSAEDKWFKSKAGFYFKWVGINTILAKSAKIAASNIRSSLIPLMDEIPCYNCKGDRLNPLARNVKVDKLTLPQLCNIPLKDVAIFVDTLKLKKDEEKLLEEVLKQLKSRLVFLIEVGLDYLTLNRKAPSLSNGESQRIRLARQLGSSLTGILYVLDEPTIGLHPRDSDRLHNALQKLKALNNTLLLVEHDPLTMAHADYLLDFGPGAGIHGGHVMARGTLKQLLKNPESLTGEYLSGKKTIPIPTKKRVSSEFFSVEGASAHNLKNLSLKFPIGTMIAVTGVSGSGKSTLMYDVVRPAVERYLQTYPYSGPGYQEWKGATLNGLDAFNKMIVIDQDPIGHTVRSDVGTYVDLLPVLREFYASLAGSRTKGLLPRHFSYNHRKGMCTTCFGLGYRKVEMHFLPAVKVICEQCKGLRLNPLSLEVYYQEKNFGQLLDTTVEEASKTFHIIPKAKRIFDTLQSVGLGYLKLGQEIATLSNGEAQRIKLSRELAKRGTGRTLYLLDEPTTGLHFEDVQKLLKVLHQLVNKGNTMIVIEHHLDVIKNADSIIDLGPEAGDEGGEIVFSGSMEDLLKNPRSYTGQFLKKHLNHFD